MSLMNKEGPLVLVAVLFLLDAALLLQEDGPLHQ